MTTAKLAIDPFWQCLCPSWTTLPARLIYRTFARPKRPGSQRAASLQNARNKSDAVARRYAMQMPHDRRFDHVLNPLYQPSFDGDEHTDAPRRKETRTQPRPRARGKTVDAETPTQALYGLLRSAAIDGKTNKCSAVAGRLVKERGEKPSLQIYGSLILSNVSHDEGGAWRVNELLKEMEKDGLEPDIGICHAVLKVLSVHPDHLLRADILDYMSRRWYQLSEDGTHDVIASLLREGLFELGLAKMDKMRQDSVHIQPWLLDLTVYVLCEANEMDEAYRIMHQRLNSGETNLSRSLWHFFLDKGSESRHHPSTSLAWSSQVNQGYLNPSSGVCLNVLATAAKGADAVMATEVFSHLGQRGTVFGPIHYELLISTYISTDPPDLKRAISILTIMPLEKLEPTIAETRALFLYLRSKPDLIPEALATLRDLHGQGRKIPIAALNLLIECYVEENNLSDAMKLYKQIHTFAPIAEGASKTFANIDTFNYLLKACREASPPDYRQASFLVSELLALRIKPTAVTYDRLILVFLRAGEQAVADSVSLDQGRELIDFAFRHFTDMQTLGLMPRFGTIENLGKVLSRLGDPRCWDLLQAAEDKAELISGWGEKGHWARKNVEAVFEQGWEKVDVDEVAEGDVEAHATDSKRQSSGN